MFGRNIYSSWQLNKKCTESGKIQKSKREVFSETPFIYEYWLLPKELVRLFLNIIEILSQVWTQNFLGSLLCTFLLLFRIGYILVACTLRGWRFLDPIDLLDLRKYQLSMIQEVAFNTHMKYHAKKWNAYTCCAPWHLF